MYTGIDINLINRCFSFAWGEAPGKFKLVEISGRIVGIGVKVEVSFLKEVPDAGKSGEKDRE
tara:strand:+ start:521 stop:706 length:186 start_codon:yes stop_codon:yes gene_type:complete